MSSKVQHGIDGSLCVLRSILNGKTITTVKPLHDRGVKCKNN